TASCPLPSLRNNPIPRNTYLRNLIRKLQVHQALFAGVGQNHHAGAIRIAESHMIKSGRVTMACEAYGPTLHMLGEMPHRPVLPTLYDLPIPTQCHQPSTGEGPNVRFAVLIENQIPADDRSTPVAQNSRERRSPIRPIFRIIRIGDVRSAFGPVKGQLRM